MEYVYREHVERFAQFAVRVWDIPYDAAHPEKAAAAGIEALRSFWRGLGVPLTLTEAGVSCDRLEEIATLVTEDGPIGGMRKLDKPDVLNILNASV